MEMHGKRKGDQAVWLNSVCGTRVPWLEPEGDERELSRMSDKQHLVKGRFSVSAKIHDSGLWRRTPCLTSRLLEQRTGQKNHDNEVTGQTARRAVDVHTNFITTSRVQILSSIVARQMK